MEEANGLSSRILVVDDDLQIRRVMHKMLAGQDYTVNDARSGEEALEKLQRDPYDLVLLDLAMPGIGGLEACRAIRASWNSFSGEKTLASEAGAARGFYRPHSGFPDWQPSANPQEVLDEALVWACKSGRTEVLARLVRAGACLDTDPYRGTPLIWAAVCNRLETPAWLIDHGATVNQKATFGGLTHGQGVTALYMASQSGHLSMVQYLIQRGADPKIKDDLYGADAERAANHFGQIAVRDYLRSQSTAQRD